MLGIYCSHWHYLSWRRCWISVVMPAEVCEDQTCIWVNQLTFLTPVIKAFHSFSHPRLFHRSGIRRKREVYIDENQERDVPRILLQSVFVVVLNVGWRGLCPLF